MWVESGALHECGHSGTVWQPRAPARGTPGGEVQICTPRGRPTRLCFRPPLAGLRAGRHGGHGEAQLARAAGLHARRRQLCRGRWGGPAAAGPAAAAAARRRSSCASSPRRGLLHRAARRWRRRQCSAGSRGGGSQPRPAAHAVAGGRGGPRLWLGADHPHLRLPQLQVLGEVGHGAQGGRSLLQRMPAWRAGWALATFCTAVRVQSSAHRAPLLQGSSRWRDGGAGALRF